MTRATERRLGRAGKDCPDSDRFKNAIFHAVHRGKTASASIVESAQMQQAVDRVEQQLALDRMSAQPRLPPGLAEADHHFAAGYPSARVVVQFKREDVGWPRDSHELFVQAGHGAIPHDGHRKFPQRRPKDGMSLAQSPLERGGITTAHVRGDGKGEWGNL